MFELRKLLTTSRLWCILEPSVKRNDFTKNSGELMILKDLKMAVLLDFYGPLLTNIQRDVLECYYDEDLSISEIADNRGITRQGVYDVIRRSEVQLEDIEKKLLLVERFSQVNKALEEILAVSFRGSLLCDKRQYDQISGVLSRVEKITKLALQA